MRPAGTTARRASTQAVVWRDGVHIVGTSLWCDARRPRDLCFVSSADALKSVKHGQMIATMTTFTLLARPGENEQGSQLSVPLARPFTLGALRVELFASGYAPGAASLSLEGEPVGYRRIVYTGAVNPRGGGLAGSADSRPSDVLIVDARYGHPRYSFPAPADACAATVDFATSTASAGSAAILLVTSASKGVDVAAAVAVAAPQMRVRAHRAIYDRLSRVRRQGWRVPDKIRRSDGVAHMHEVLVWPVYVPLAESKNARIALVSGEAVEPARVAEVGADVGFAWSNCADYSALAELVEASGADDVYVTGRYAEAFAQQRDYTPLMRVRQLSLF